MEHIFVDLCTACGTGRGRTPFVFNAQEKNSKTDEIMTTFKRAMQTKDKTTEKGAPTHSTSGKALVDLFFRMGAMRQRPDEDVRELFMRAFGQDREGAMRALFYNRDVRQGQGERRFFRVAFREVAEKHPDVARKNLDLIPEYGRWDDVWAATFGTPVQEDAFELIKEQLEEDAKEVFDEEFSIDRMEEYVE